ncbi:MAG: hypothetical protein JXN61_10095 [Sedimentisphaerales bacterium]|nr:hypothetical protein [Sedimentisphaerales bacterium]
MLAVCALGGIRFCRGQENFSKNTDESVYLPSAIAGQHKPLTLVCVGGDQGWLFAAAAPVAAKIREQGKSPVLLALASKSVVEQTILFEQMAGLTDSCTLLAPVRDQSFRPFGEDVAINHVPTTADPAKAGFLLAKCFWGKTDVAVAAASEDHQAVLLGAALACRLCAPFIPLGRGEKLADYSDDLKELNVRRIIIAVSDNTFDAGFAESIEQQTETLDARGIYRRLVEAIGCSNVRNIVVFRAPADATDARPSYWLAPYLAFVRGSLPVASQSREGRVAEENVKDVIMQYSLRPRTVTILGDYESIDLIRWSEGTEENSCEIAAEPCSRPFADGAAEVGVGRIAFGDLPAASTLVARWQIREHTVVPGGPKVLMIANPKTDYTPLPLCETISRVTAKEFKNLGIHTDEFYVANCRDPIIQELTRQSQLIIFEGHITDFTLFKAYPHYDDGEYYDYYEHGEGHWDGFMDGNDSAYYRPYDSTEEDSEGEQDQMDGEIGILPNGRTWLDDEMTEPGVFGPPDEEEEPVDPCRLDGIPLLILQSCHSLDDSASLVLKTGAAGIVGSVTNINSASGSAFIKAYSDALLYGDETLGEALRDARNYLLCVNAVKNARGHSLQSKVKRVAYGFHLWGDPEMNLFAGLRAAPILRPVSVRFVPPDGILISAPRQRLDTVETERYVLTIFPGSEVAGLVKKLKDRDARRVLPIYFFRMSMPAEIASLSHSSLVRSEDTSPRAAFLVDSFKRFLYVLYFPEKDGELDEFMLQFAAFGR